MKFGTLIEFLSREGSEGSIEKEITRRAELSGEQGPCQVRGTHP